MRLVYLSGPIRPKNPDGTYRVGDWWGYTVNIKNAEFVAAHLWANGIAVICPHKNTAGFDGIVPDDLFIKGDLRMIEGVDAIVMLPGWRNSDGANAEKDYAISKGIPVVNAEYNDEVFTRPTLIKELAASINLILDAKKGIKQPDDAQLQTKQ